MFDFTDEQNEFLLANGNVVLHACPGSGKTTVVAKKLIQYLETWDKLHQGVAVLSFTNVASQEIEKQTQELIPTGFAIEYPHYVGTLDSFINSFLLLRFGYLLFEKPQRPTIAFKDLYSLPFRYWRRECHRKGCVDNMSDFRWDKDGNLLRNKIPVTCASNGAYGPPCFQYKKMLLNKGLVFQSEVSSLAFWILRDYPEIANALATRFPVIILDEAQDTSVEQMAILDLINQAGTESMFLVGDPDQSIYEWRNATPECFIEKMNSEKWLTMPLTANFRSSQMICNATKLFSNTLKDKEPSNAKGTCAGYPQKPILLFYEGNISGCRNSVIEKFEEICSDNAIPLDSSNIAIVTRSRVHSDTDITGLWKSHEIEFLAQSAYEWSVGSRKKAYELCEKFLFGLTINEYKNIQKTLEIDVEAKMSYDVWRSMVIDLLINLPPCNLPIGDWIKQGEIVVTTICTKYGLAPISGKTFSNIVKIKSRDKAVPHFKSIPLNNYFESKQKSKCTISSVHGVKGETYDALMLIVESRTGQTITPKFLNEDPLDQELMRIAYVAMTRPRKLLVVAMPKIASRTTHARFPVSSWDYINI